MPDTTNISQNSTGVLTLTRALSSFCLVLYLTVTGVTWPSSSLAATLIAGRPSVFEGDTGVYWDQKKLIEFQTQGAGVGIGYVSLTQIITDPRVRGLAKCRLSYQTHAKKPAYGWESSGWRHSESSTYIWIRLPDWYKVGEWVDGVRLRYKISCNVPVESASLEWEEGWTANPHPPLPKAVKVEGRLVFATVKDQVDFGTVTIGKPPTLKPLVVEKSDDTTVTANGTDLSTTGVVLIKTDTGTLRTANGQLSFEGSSPGVFNETLTVQIATP